MYRLLMAYGRITTEGWLGMRWVKVGDGRDNGGQCIQQVMLL